MRLSIPHIARGFALTWGAWLLLFYVQPAYGQGTPTPPPPTSIVGEFSTAAQTLGTVSVVSIVAVLILLIAVGALFVGVYRLGKPMVDNIDAANRRADTAAAELIRTTEANRIAEARKLEIQAQTAQTLERTANILTGVETKTEATTGRNTAVTNINAHTDVVFSEAKASLEQAAAKIDEAAKTIADVVTKEHLNGELTPIRNELHDIAVTLRKKGDTGNLPPLSSITDADPNAPSSPPEPPP